MNKNKIFIYLLISLFVFLIISNFIIPVEAYDNCVLLSEAPSTTEAERTDKLVRENYNKVVKLEERLNKAIYVYKQPKKNEKILATIGPAQQSISDSQSGDVTGDTKITGL